jgi:glycerol uptake facilitator-like aquaporin
MAIKKAKKVVKKTAIKKPQAAKSNKLTSKMLVTNIKKILTCKCDGKKGMPSIGALIAEFIGTFLLVSSVFAVQGQPLFVAFAVIGIILIIAGASKAHINPAVTIGAWVTKKICAVCAILYIAAQALGASAAFLVASAFLENTKSTVVDVYSSVPTMFQAASLVTDKELVILFTELLGAFIIALGVSKAIKSTKVSYALTYGFAVLIALIIAGSATSMLLTEANTTLTFLNPVTAIAANAVTWSIWPIAIYAITPIIGSIAGFALNDLLGNDK